ncbi:MAG TPA: sigma-70 family RNA polymerase sigma factor [Kofleriaceae bacterium]|nr:sigma-70 family RNA polymerase sigma factor [Kofleriaceae bacterium]
MGRHDPETTAEELLAHSGWLRALAVRLVGDADVAEDLVQETWIAAARRSPEARESLRPWLAKVLRDAFRMRARSEGRRSAREQAATLVGTAEPDEVPTPESLVVRAQAQRRLVDLVLRLEEPYRSTVLLHYSEGVSLADIARAQGVPAGTVRWRMKTAVDQLRAWLDETGGRKQWVVTLLALPKGALVAQKTSKVAIAIVLLLLLAVGAAVFVVVRGKDDKRASNAAHNGGRGSGTTAGDPGGTAGEPGGAAVNVITAGTPPLEWFGQRGVKPRRVAGRVLTLDGKPVAGAAVELGSISTMGGLGVPPSVRTDAAGAFDFGARMAASYTVTASAPGLTGDTRSVDLRDPTIAPPPDHLELRLGPCDNAVFGTVRDASGGPVEGARVQWLSNSASGDGSDPSLARGSSVLSSATGAYELCVVGGRKFVVTEVTAEGYGAIIYQTQVWGRRKLDFALVPEAIVVGRVIREDTREPVAHAAVALVSGQWGVERTAARGAVTGSDGTFRITNVAPGPHFLDAIADNLATARETPIIVEAGQTSEPVELVLETRSVVRGTVVEDGKPVAGATITARVGDTRRPSADAVSQSDGTFVLDRVPRGTVRFFARPYDVEKPTTFTVSKPEHDGVVLSVKPLGAIVGTVLRNGKPATGALIELQGMSSQELGPIVSDGDGRFAARGLRPGKWVAFASSDRQGAFGRAKEDIELAAGETKEVTIDMPYGAAISGRVVDQDGAPVPNVSVAFRHTSVDDVGLATTSADGSYRATMMIGGTYRPLISLGVRTATTLRPAQGDQFPVFTLADGASELTGIVLAVRVDHLAISGRVVDETGAPVPDAHVAAERTEPGAEPHFWRWYQQTTTITDVDGRFTVDDLSSGPHAIQVRTAAGLETIVSNIAAGRRDVSIVLPSAGSIEGTLAGFDAVVRVIAVRDEARGAEAPLRGTVTGNTFTVPSLGPGAYLVSAFTDTEVASAPVTVTAGKAARVALTGGGTGSITGTVRDFETGRPVEGMRCNVFARAGESRTSGAIGTGAQSDRNGVFELPAVAAGDVAIACWPSGAVYTQGLRLITVAPGERLQLEVPVVAIRQDPTQTIGGFGADFDPPSLVSRLFRVSPRGPAGLAGLADGDVITAVDNKSVVELHHQGVWFLLIYHPPGTSVPVTARRGARSFTVNLVIGPTDD